MQDISTIAGKTARRQTYATLSQLPALAGMDTALLPAVRDRVPKVGVVNPDGGKVPVAHVYDLSRVQDFLAKSPSPATPFFGGESMLADTERKRRRKMFAHECLVRHGIQFRFSGKASSREYMVEFGVHATPWEGADEILFDCHVSMPQGGTLEAFLESGRFDDGLFEAAVETTTTVASHLMAKGAAGVLDAVAGWREDYMQARGRLEAGPAAAVERAMARKLGRVAVIVTGARKIDQIGLAAQRPLALAHGQAMALVEEQEATRLFSQRLGYDRYPSLFPEARSIGRRILFLAGPTNSGKTHEAIALAVAAPSAEILSPLRLLALEHRDLLSAQGVEAGLVTGEERDLPDGVTHIARTIETMDTRRRVDVAVIDEIQMLGDRSRGWAWTQAVVGVPADLVVLTGSPEAFPLVKRLAATLGEPLEVRRFERKTPLEVTQPVSLGNLRRGDALIAFSRRDVHRYRDAVRETGLSVATIYGALGPEVRRSEAARFRNGEADVVVATDAIGMGLNLPIGRVVFSATEKFDGERRRRLTASEILQIAGRAGRFGHFEGGEVTALRSRWGAEDVWRIREALDTGAESLSGKAFVRPNMAAVRAGAEVLDNDRLAAVLMYLRKTLVRDHPDLKMSDIEDDIEKAARLDKVPLPLEVRYTYAIAPLNLRGPTGLDTLVAWAREHHRDGEVGPYLPRPSADLEKLEHQVHMATVWLWLSHRLDGIYRGREKVEEAQRAANATIEARLAQSSGRRQDRKGKGKAAPVAPPAGRWH